MTFLSALRLLASFCQLAGFVNNTLATVFLGTVGAIAVSCFLFFVSPRGYSMFFVNKPIVRLLLFTIWFGAGFLASAPLNQGIWGAYALLQGTCWLSWQPGMYRRRNSKREIIAVMFKTYTAT